MEPHSLSLDIIVPIHFLPFSPDISTAVALSAVNKVYRAVACGPVVINHLRGVFGITYRCSTFSFLVQAVHRKEYTHLSHLHMHPAKLLRMAIRSGSQEGITKAKELGAVFYDRDLEEAGKYGHTEIVDQHVNNIKGGYSHAAVGYSYFISRYPNNKERLMEVINRVAGNKKMKILYNLVSDEQSELLYHMMTKGIIDEMSIYEEVEDQGKMVVRRDIYHLAVKANHRLWHLSFPQLDKVKERVAQLIDQRDIMGEERYQWCLSNCLLGTEICNVNDCITYLREQGAVSTKDIIVPAFTREGDRLAREALRLFDVDTITSRLEDVDTGNKEMARVCLCHAGLLADHGVELDVECFSWASDRDVVKYQEGLKRHGFFRSPSPCVEVYMFRVAIQEGDIEGIRKGYWFMTFTEVWSMFQYVVGRGMREVMECMMQEMKKAPPDEGLSWEEGARLLATTGTVENNVAWRGKDDREEDYSAYIDKDIRRLLEEF